METRKQRKMNHAFSQNSWDFNKEKEGVIGKCVTCKEEVKECNFGRIEKGLVIYCKNC